MHCVQCKKLLGFTNEPAAYVYGRTTFCPTHMDKLDHQWRMSIDRACGSTSQWRRSEQLTKSRKRDV